MNLNTHLPTLTALIANDGNIKATALARGINRRTVYRHVEAIEAFVGFAVLGNDGKVTMLAVFFMSDLRSVVRQYCGGKLTP